MVAVKKKEIRRGYKRTDVGVIPQDWDVKPVGDCLCRAPRYGIGAAAVEYSNILPKYIRITDISENGQYRPEKMVSVNHSLSQRYFLSSGDIVVARTGASVGKSYLYNHADGPLVFAGFLICLSPNQDILSPEFLNNYLRTSSYWNWVKTTSMRSGQPGINGREFADLLIPVPTVREQVAIANALSDADNLIALLELTIRKKKQIKVGTMQRLFSGKQRLQGFKAKWQKKTLGEIGNTYGGLSGKSKKDFDNGEYPYIPFMNIMANPVIDTNSFQYVNITANERQNTALKGDIFFNGSSETPEEVGMCSVLLEDVPNLYLNSFCFGFRLSKEPKAVGLYFAYFFRSTEGRKLFLSLAQGATRYNLSKGRFLKMEIPYPEPDEQASIALVLSTIDIEISETEARLRKAQDLKRGMLQQLLTGNIRIV